MNINVKPKILVSKCIEHVPCRYDGSLITSEFVKRIKDYVDIVTVCPEVEIGLSVPREVIRLVYKDDKKKLVSSNSGIDYTDKMDFFSQNYSMEINDSNIHGAILKSRSPSCGIKDVKTYPSFGKVNSLPIKTQGFFGEAVIKNNPFLPVEDEGRLLNYDIRVHFLTRIFTLAKFDLVKAKKTMGELVKFQSENKYLLMAYHQTEQKELGRIVANYKNKSLDEIFEEYEMHLKKALMIPLRKGKNTNMILHMFGYASKYLSAEEKAFFLEELSLYNQHKKPLSVIMTVLYGWVIRFDISYLKMQTIFNPYPIEVLDVLDSGKGIK